MMTNRPYITDADISIVVQGPVSKTPVPRKIGGQSHQLKGGVTHNVLEALRDLFPRAELILSTWEGTDATGLIADKICLSPDPGFAMVNPISKKLKFNLNRYVVSSQRGIQAATRPYTLKLRSDMLFVNDDFLAFWNEQKPVKRNPEFSVFKDFILNPAIYARKSVTPSKKTFPLYFYPSDWAHFGRTEDLNTLFDIPLFPEAELVSYFLENSALRTQFEDPFPEYHFQFHPEQLVLLACLKKQGWQIPYEHRLEYRPELQALSDQLMVNNFIFLNQSQWLYFSLKHLFMQHQLTSSQYHGLYDFATWQADYTRLVDSTYRPFETAEPNLRQDYFDAYFGVPLTYSYPLAHQLHPKNPTIEGVQISNQAQASMV